jgi:hypothetical protein
MKRVQVKAGFKILYYGIFAAFLAFGLLAAVLLGGIKLVDDIQHGHYGGIIGGVCAAIVLAILAIKNRKKVGR